jgi:arabinose-5-phosphate isomerase
VAIVDDEQHVLGVVTAGDLTRLMEREQDIFTVKVEEVMNRTPKLAGMDELGSAVVFRMERFKVMAMPVLDDDQRMVGMIHLHDLMRAGAA